MIKDRPILLCSKGRCCPTITRTSVDTFQISDDYGHSAKLSRGELDAMIGVAQRKDNDDIITVGRLTMYADEAALISKHL